MSARACQLCGKPLSRIRVGTDGNFCSHEHRNQYRLRQGMDRLMEANTVANLMRRRERPKSIVPKQVDSASSLERRSFVSGPPMPVRAGKPMRYGRMSIGPASGLGQARQTHTAPLQVHVLPTGDARRSMRVSRWRSQGLFLPLKPRRGGLGAASRTAAPARQISLSALRGVLLRVSTSAGFRLRRVELPVIDPGHSTNTLRAGFRVSAPRPMARPSAMRVLREQWSTPRTGLHVAGPRFAFYRPWGSLRPGPRGISASNPAVRAIPPGPVTTRMAEVRIELQESMRYAINSEEDKA